MTEQPIPCVIYAAKSTQDRHASIPEQLADGREMAAENGWEIVGECQDEGFSAYSGNRGPGLVKAQDRAAAAAAEHGVTAMLIAQAHDRFARGAGDKPGAPQSLGEVWHAMRRRDVHLRTVEDDAELRDEASVAAIGRRAHIDSERKSKSVKKGLRRRADERGQSNGGPRPLGYRYCDLTGDGKPTGLLVVVEAEAKIVQRVYAEYLAGRPQRTIARDLNDEEVPTATGGRWYQATVRNMLRNPLYAGRVHLNAESYDGHHEPIIDAETWERARQLREAGAATRGKGRGRRPRGSHLFMNGLLRCGVCGGAMSTVTKPTHTPGRLYEAYVCFLRMQQGPKACSQPNVPREVIDSAVWRFFEQMALDVGATRRAISEHSDQKLSEHGALRQQAEQELARVQAAFERIEADYIAEKISADQWARLEAKLSDQITAAQAQAEQHERQRQAIMESIAEFDAEAAIVEELTAIRAQVAGQAQAGSREGLDSFRATLRRLFTGFELVSPTKPFGTGALDGTVWTPQAEEGTVTVTVGSGYVLEPHIRPEALDLGPDADFSAGSPAIRRVALSLGSNKGLTLAR